MTVFTNDKHITYVYSAWLVLMILTAASWWVGTDHDIAGLGHDVAMVSILVLSFAKIYVVGHSFMELREAAHWLNWMFKTWCVVLCSVLCGIYLAI